MSSYSQQTPSANSAPATILTLPAEIKLHILCYLPGRQIQACRRVCREFTELIDSRENQKAIIDPIRRRVAKHHWPLLQLLASTYQSSLLGFLFGWILSRGVWPYIERNRLIVTTAAKQWAVQNSHTILKMVLALNDPNIATPASLPIVLNRISRLLGIIAEALAQAYIDVHFPDLFAGSPDTSMRMCDVSTKQKFFSLIDSRIQGVDRQYIITRFGLPLNRAELGRCYDGIVARQAPLVSRGNSAPLVVPRGPSPQLAVPQFVLTAFDYWYQEHDSTSSTEDSCSPQVRIQGRCTANDLSRILLKGVPDLSPFAAWCVRSQWADNLICQALGGKVLTNIQKATVIEDLYVF
ncbi:hypothetical protein CBER1_06966 [Cercospora berteroae]|uniref:F-box domain-containing protein n=1 Tax=Cercospora berteroae TaxID=357750 RepID=A0A2S6BSD4_9PEZI|nr:hypothetical protein CBER1_06966 [Cercospora berteroae]